jgi:hypothetical protein
VVITFATRFTFYGCFTCGGTMGTQATEAQLLFLHELSPSGEIHFLHGGAVHRLVGTGWMKSAGGVNLRAS